MSLEIKIPTVGESISEVTLSKWVKKDGDTVKLNDVLCELESDKATFELNAEQAGVLKTVVKEGDTLAIGTLIGLIQDGAGVSAPAPAAAPVAVAAAPAPTPVAAPAPSPAPAPAAAGKVLEMKVPTVGESITEVTVGSWTKKDGDYVKLNEVLCEIESDKATFELTAEADGTLQIVAKTGDVLPIGGLICKIAASGAAPAAAASAPVSAPATTAAPAGNYAEGHPSPAAAKILADKGISPSEIKGSGVDGRITKEDASAAQKSAPAPTPSAEPAKPAASASAPAAPAGPRGVRREKMTSLRKTVSRRLVAVKNETAMLTTFNEVEMKPIMDIRAKYKDQFKEKYGVGLGFMSFFTKAVTTALQEFPAVNASIEGEEIVFHDYADVSIAVSAPKGLVVPVIRNAEKLSFSEIESTIVGLAKKARDNKLSIEEMTGGTFTITNGGVFGSMLSTPIINAPQSAILGMHNIVERPVVVNGEVVVRPIMYVALSYDHRIIDGRESVSFLVRVKQLLEDPARLLLSI
ncbi:MAG: 2-oxoglutarate dehydrogenase complex dihydrolipoyllysine-residue succinyltransferase [Cytophagales bacterium]|nr:2-oxoglutarate dehydrogenase complex dihydrolipoyllysine-residue succinyltransferase [Cytophagales bacterium]